MTSSARSATLVPMMPEPQPISTTMVFIFQTLFSVLLVAKVPKLLGEEKLTSFFGICNPEFGIANPEERSIDPAGSDCSVF
jgi:hypothetical protein